MLALILVMGMVNPVMAEEEDTPLTKEMDTVSSSLKGLRKAKDNAAKAALVRKAQEGCLASLKYLPKIFKDIKDKEELAKKTADYKRLMGLMYSKLAELELAFLNGDEDKADKAYDELKDLKKEGHRAYTEDD